MTSQLAIKLSGYNESLKAKQLATMKRTILTGVILAIVLTLLPFKAFAIDFSNERLNYEVVYQWGMVWKHAGDATLTIKKNGNMYYSQLVGKTRSWADKLFPVRDTLKCSMNEKLQPLRYEKLTHEQDYYAHDVVTYSYYYGNTNAKGTRYRPGKPKVEINLSAKCQAYDMVSVFYMLRNLDFSKMTTKPVSTVMFSGKEKEYLTLTFKGKETVKLRDGTKHESYRINFRFTKDGGKKSSDNIDAWLSTDAQHIPLLLVGKLRFGEIRCYYKS